MFWNKADVWFFVWQDSAAEDEKENKEEKEKKKEEEKEKEEKKEEEEEVSQIITVMIMYLIIVGYPFAQKKEFRTIAEEYECLNR